MPDGVDRQAVSWLEAVSGLPDAVSKLSRSRREAILPTDQLLLLFEARAGLGLKAPRPSEP
ncbi:hypothetical protein K32_11500 [Kaistia sp. 32K]|nr:hypothetical protein K32_11500 [Kaistia sp. 32K]